MDAEFKTGDDIFKCKKCGDCCNGFGGTYVTEQDIINISTYITVDPEKFAGRYCDRSGSRMVLTRGQDGYCIFFDKLKQCTIHPVKPRMCKAWPFIQAVITHPENWNTMADSCPGMRKDIPYKQLQEIVEKEKLKVDFFHPADV